MPPRPLSLLLLCLLAGPALGQDETRDAMVQPPARTALGEEPVLHMVSGPGLEERVGAKPVRAQARSPLEQIDAALDEIERSDPSARSRRGFQALEALGKRAREAPPERRDGIITAGLPSFTQEVEQLDPLRDPPALVRESNLAAARISNATGGFEDGRKFSTRQLETAPEDRDALISRSQANYGLGRVEDAFDDANRAAKIDPSSSDPYTARAMANYGMRRYLQAVEDSRRALALNPNDATAFAIMKLSEGKVPPMSIETFRSPLGAEIQREYHSMVQQMTQAEQRVRAPAAAASPAPPAVDGLVRQAMSKIAVKDYAGALGAADRAIAEDPNNAAAYYQRSVAHNLLGNFDEAVQDATQALMLSPRDVGSRDARAWAYNHLGRFRDAIADAHHSLEVEPQGAYAFANLGYSHEKLGDLPSMLRHLKAAAAINPQFEPAYRDAAQRHGLEPEPMGSRRLSPPRSDLGTRDAARRRSFGVVLISSVTGGVLIALGIIHLWGSRLDSGAALPRRRRSKLEEGYQLGRAVGHGGMGVVYEAFDKTLERRVAVKVLRDELKLDEKAKQRFLEEARTVAGLHHPGIVDIHSIVDDEAGLYLIFEFVEGRTLEQALRERGRLSLPEAKALLKQVCQALDFAHKHGVVHRDLKPGNIMLTEQGSKVMDFGISRHAREAIASISPAESATAHGTPHYMAPEQQFGAVRKESDVYSLGACLYEMLTGQPPFPAPSGPDMKLNRDYPKASTLAPELPPAVDPLIDMALHPDPDHRIRSPHDFWALLERIKTPIPA